MRVDCDVPLVRGIVLAYRNYYREALLHQEGRQIWEKKLQHQVRAIAGEFGISKARRIKWNELERCLTKEFKRLGYFALFGRVSPFLSLLVWRSQKEKFFHVPLLESKQKVRVILLDQFVELGWMHFATFGRYYIGGWAKKDALYCVSQAYKRKYDSEAFRVSYLTHEAQHFSDYKRFPGLAQVDLEYRAKLAELITSRDGHSLLRKFRAEARSDDALPHCFAAYKIMEGVGTRSGSKVRQFAVDAMEEHSRSLMHGHRPNPRRFQRITLVAQGMAR